MTELKRTPLFNERGDDSPENQQIINGNPTGISNLNENKYKWSNGLYRVMTGNFWVPEKVSMADDKLTISNLTPEEDSAVKDTLSFLIFLDSFQCINLPNIQKYITAPNVANLISIQQYQEVIHSQSYQYILDSLYPLTTRESIYNRWRDNPELLARIKYVTSIAEAFEANPNEETFKDVIIMNIVLESIYFYQGFMLFDQLASRGKLVQTSKIIDYIRNDEMTHVGLFINIGREIFTTTDHIKVKIMIDKAVHQEIAWAHHIYGNSILGISMQSSEEYVKYLANDRLARMGIEMMYPEFIKNPYQHLDVKKRENFFEAGAVTSYDRSESIAGWDDF